MRGFQFILGRRALIVFLALLVATGAFIGAPAVARTLAGSSPPGSQEVSAASTDSASTEGLPAADGEEGALLEPSGHSAFLQETGGTWTVTNFPSSTPSAPAARREHAMAALPAGGVLLFGGAPSSGAGETWLFNTASSAWGQLLPTSSPTARNSHAMAATPSGALLFGGNNGGGETWLFDNAANSWTLVPTTLSSSTPTARWGHAIAATPSGIILFGGQGSGSGSSGYNDTWLFNTTSGTCSPITITGTVPPARYDHAMAYDASSGKVVLFGGSSVSTYYNDTWLFSFDIITGNGIWTETNTPIDPTTTPTARSGHAMAATPSGVLLFGGNNGGGETWLFDTGALAWTKLSISYAPSARSGHAMVYDISSSKVLLFGGFDTSSRNDTWVFNESNWSWSQVAASPAARQGSAMAATPSTATSSGVLLFGGYDGTRYYYNDTWLFNTGTNTWTQVTITGTPVPAGNPSARDYHAMAATPSGVLLFGGYNNVSPNYLGDTWLFDPGTNSWGTLDLTTTITAPSKRQGHAMAALPGGDVLLFGGYNNVSPNYLGDTWLFNTATNSWGTLDLTTTITAPTKRYGHAMAATPEGALLFGGWNGSAYYNDTWLFTYDSTTKTGIWTKLTTTTSPTKRYGHAMAATPLGDVLLFGGFKNVSPNYLGDTWLFNSTTTTWSRIDFTDTSTPVARNYHAMAATPSGVLLFGGTTNGLPSGALGDTWLFSQEEPPSTSTIAVTSPTAGDIWVVGETATITWTSTDVTGTCTVDLSRDGGGTWTQTLTTNTATQGIYLWTVSGTTSNNCKVRVSSSDGTRGTSNTFTITHAATPTLVVLTPATATIQAGASQTYVLIAQDTETNTWDVTPSGAYSIDPDAGGSWADNTYTASKAGTWTVSATYSQDSTNYSATATLHVTPDGLGSITVTPTDSTIAAGAPQAYTVNAFDIYGNPMGDVSATATFTTEPIAGVTIAGSTITATLVGDYVVTAHYTSQTATALLEVTPAALHHFTFAIIDNQVAGVGFTTTITAYDTLGNVKIDYAGTPNLSGFDGTISPATATFLAGISNPTLTITKAMTGTLTVTDSGGAAGSVSFTVSPSALRHFAFGTIADQVAGVGFTTTITAYDFYNNVKTNYSSSPALSGFDGTISPATATFTNGVAAPTLTITKAMTGTLTVTDGSVSAGSVSFTVSPSSLHHFAFATIADQAAGVGFTTTLTAYDFYNNTKTNYSSSPALSGFDGTLSPATATFLAGVSNPTLTITKAMTGTVTVTDSGVSAGSVSFTVSPSVLHHFSWGTISSPQVAGVGFTTTVTAYDSFNNVQTGYAGSPALSGFDGTLSPATATFLAGVSNPTLTITKAMTGTVTVTDGSVSAGSVSFTVTHAASVDRLSLSPASATIVAGTTQTYSTTAYDLYNNSWDVTSLGSYAIGLGAGGSWVANTYTASMAGTWTVTASYGNKTATALLEVNPAALKNFAFANIDNQVAGVGFTVTITAYDSLGSIKTDYTGTATLSGFDGTVSPASLTFSGGLFTGTLTITKAMTGTLTLSDGLISNGSVSFTVTHAASVDHLSLSPASATIVAGTTQTYTTTAYDTYSNPWDVTSLGSYAISLGAGGSWSANTYTASYAGVWTMTASFSGKSATATLEVTHSNTVDHVVLTPVTATIVAGTATTYALIAADTQTNTWDVTSAGIYTIVEPAAGGSWSANTYTASYAGIWTVSATYDTKSATALLEVTPAALHHFTFATIGGQVAGVGFTTTLTAYDSFNNVQTGYAGSPALSGFDGTLSPATATFLAGVSNPTLTITKAMTGTGTVTDGSVSAGSVSFTVSPSALHHLTLSPSKAGILPTQTQAYQAEGFDFFNNSRGDVTPTTTFSIEAGAGGSWSPSNTYNPGNSGSWTVTGANATDTGPYGTASGTALLTVSATLHLSSPVGGEDWIRGYAYPITWTSTGVTGTTTIELSRDNGATWETLTLTTATGGSFLWTVTTPRTSQALVRVSGSSQSTQSGLFRLRDPQIDILSPIGGELWTIGSQHAITWTSTDLVWGTPTTMDILLARNGVDFTFTLTSGFTITTSSGFWNWTVTGPGTINAKIRLVGADCQDSSPDYFTITSTLFPYIGGTTTLTTSDPWLEISGGSAGAIWVTPLDPQYTNDPNLNQFIQETGKRSALFFDIGKEGLTGTLTIVLHFNHRLGEETFQLYLWDGAGWIKVDGTLNLVDHTFTFTIDAGELDGTPFSLGGNPAAMPSMSPWALGLLSLALLSTGGWWFSRRRRPA